MKRFAVIGSPIRHSLSPKIHFEFAKSLDLKITYEAIEVTKANFVEETRKLLESSYDGLNVTLPLKEVAYQLADKTSERAKESEAANTLWLKNGDIHADSTDGIGFIEDLNMNGISLKSSSILLVGAGGSARSILPEIIKCQPKEVTIINRTEEKAKSLSNLVKTNKTHIFSSNLYSSLERQFTAVINTSSASLLGEKIIVPKGIFNSTEWVYDLSYSKKITEFNLLAMTNGVKICFDGLGMLVNQAAKSFEIWTEKKPEVNQALQNLRSYLNMN